MIEVLKTLRVLVVCGAVIALAFLVKGAMATQSSHGPTAVDTPSPYAREIQALIDANKAISLQKAPTLQQPAITIVKDTGLVHGLSDAQVAQILTALKPKTVEAVAVHASLSVPTPAPTPKSEVYKGVYDAAYAADTAALNATTIKTQVDITRQEIPPSRVGSLISAQGSGLSFAVWRKHHLEADLAAVSAQGHIVPSVCGQIVIPHTELGVGPCVTFNHRALVHIGATVHF